MNVARRGGYRGRRCVVPGQAPVWVPSGRWGPRRARVEECQAILRAESIYDTIVRSGDYFGPGSRGFLTWQPHTESLGKSSPVWNLTFDVLANAVWRRGRLFLQCPHCARRATRLYVPIANLQPRCRRCWGLNYALQSWSYKPTGFLGGLLGPLAYATTFERRKKRREASKARYEARRQFLSPQPKAVKSTFPGPPDEPN